MEVGLSTVRALNFVGVLSFLILTFGFLELARRACSFTLQSGQIAASATIILISANYVYQNYLIRAALSEAIAYSLVPIAVIALLDKRYFLAATLLALHITVHPPPFLFKHLRRRSSFCFFLTRRYFTSCGKSD
jgi:hypothetical protein